MKILFKYATRGRATWFIETLTAYKNNLSGEHTYKFIITCDNDDESMNNSHMRRYMDLQQLEVHFGPHKTKIEAINADMEDQDFDILVVVSDDMVPIVPNFDAVIVQDMLQYFPDLDGALHYNDNGHCGSKLISLTVMGKKLYDRFGYIYWSEYVSLWCDNEFTDIVRQLGKVKWIDRCIIQHMFMKHGRDSLYKRNETFYDADQVVYDTRKRLDFPKALVS